MTEPPVINPPEEWKAPDALAKPIDIAPPGSRYALSAHELIRLETLKGIGPKAMEAFGTDTHRLLTLIDTAVEYVKTGLIPPPPLKPGETFRVHGEVMAEGGYRPAKTGGDVG